MNTLLDAVAGRGPYITMGDGAQTYAVPSCDVIQTHGTYPPVAQICHYEPPTSLIIVDIMLNELDGPPTRGVGSDT
jgi:hypothetical protein